MPYIKQEYRVRCDEVIKKMKEESIQANGELNYILYKFCKETVEPSYNNYKNFIGELHQCATEIERRILADYENLKIIENGDV